jgi:gliding motility-associated-like protein
MLFSLEAQKPFVCQGQYYLSLTKDRSPVSGLYEVKFSQNGQSVVLDTIAESVGLILNGMGYRITDNFIYGMDPFTGRLRRVGSDGMGVDLGLPRGLPPGALYYAGDISPDGRFLVVVTSGTITPQLVKIDLESPVYQCQVLPLVDRSVSVVDVAFDPFTGILYGNDIRNQRLVTINTESGNINSNFLVQRQVDQLGALFFDSFGNLFGYGSFNSLVADKLVAINKNTGLVTLLAQGPASVGQDGCSCPYTLELQKIVTPEVAYPCTEVVYSFVVSNGSGITRGGINLSDAIPSGLILKSVISNPFGGQVSISGNSLRINNMSVKVGIDTIRVLVEVGSDALGIYKNQAVLTGLPVNLGRTALSDNPFTKIENDSTSLLVKPLDFSFIKEEYVVCPGTGVMIDATYYGLKYLWSDGDRSSKKWLPSPGEYSLQVNSLCENIFFNINVVNDNISLKVHQDEISVDLGDEVELGAEYTSSQENTKFLWEGKNNPPPECPTCIITNAIPHNTGYYVLTMNAGINCMLQDSVVIRVNKDRLYHYPNIMSVNNDAQNDKFFLSGKTRTVKGLYLRIYDRWGNKVFNTGEFQLNDPNSGWDGTFNGTHVKNGVYVWQAALQYIDGFIDYVAGDITVIR